MLDAIPVIHTGRAGRPKRFPEKLHADKAYDNAASRGACQKRRILDRIARKNIERSDRLGRHRWVVKRTMAWLTHFRRLLVRYERLRELHRAFPNSCLYRHQPALPLIQF